LKPARNRSGNGQGPRHGRTAFAFPCRRDLCRREIRLVYTHYDRLILGGAVPGTGKLTLDQVKECGTASILDRREMGILNIGESGTVSAAGTDYTVNKGDVLYLGMGSGPVTFSGPASSTSCRRLRTAAA
jgi:5-keto 4-deoxyuronate isomerase